jgi:hypothetical protein
MSPRTRDQIGTSYTYKEVKKKGSDSFRKAFVGDVLLQRLQLGRQCRPHGGHCLNKGGEGAGERGLSWPLPPGPTALEGQSAWWKQAKARRPRVPRSQTVPFLRVWPNTCVRALPKKPGQQLRGAAKGRRRYSIKSYKSSLDIA